MIIARFIGRTPEMIGAALAAILGIVLIILGATATPTGTGRIIIGVACIVAGVLFFLDALTEPSSAS